MPAEAVRLYRVELGFQAKLPAPKTDYGPRDGGAPGVEGYPVGVLDPGGVYKAGELGAARAPGS